MSNKIKFNGDFKINYVPIDSPYNTGSISELPLTTKIKLGDVNLGINGSKYNFVGPNFSIDGFLEDVLELKKGHKMNLVFFEGYTIPLSFKPNGKNCLIDVDKSYSGKKYLIDEDKLIPQNVSCEDTTFQLTKVVNDFLFDIDERRQYSILDELEYSIGKMVSSEEYKKSLSYGNVKPYIFNNAESTKRIFYNFELKKEIYKHYDDFLNSLSNRELKEWSTLANTLNKIKLVNSNKTLYDIVNFKQPEHLN